MYDPKKLTIGTVQQHFFLLFGRRNSLYMQGLDARINLLNMGVGDLQDAVRKKVSHDQREVAIARVVCRIFGVAQHFGDLKLAYVYAGKYLKDTCAYCDAAPCICDLE